MFCLAEGLHLRSMSDFVACSHDADAAIIGRGRVPKVCWVKEDEARSCGVVAVEVYISLQRFRYA